jgi:multidrug transporter EmrE-like cation transporter
MRAAVTRLSVLSLIYFLLNAPGILVTRSAMRSSGEAKMGLVETATNPATIVGIVCYGLGFLTFVFALRYHPLTTVFPIFSGIGFITAVFGGWLILGEPIGSAKALSIATIAVGIIALQIVQVRA